MHPGKLIVHVASNKNLADLGTKLLGRIMFTRLRDAIYGDHEVEVDDGEKKTIKQANSGNDKQNVAEQSDH